MYTDLFTLIFVICLGSRTVAQPGTTQTFKMENLAARVNGLKPSIIVTKLSFLRQEKSEAVVRRCSSKQLVLKILQYLQKKNCVGKETFHKVAGLKIFYTLQKHQINFDFLMFLGNIKRNQQHEMGYRSQDQSQLQKKTLFVGSKILS